MGKLLEGFKILCTDFDHILEKRRTNWIYYSSQDTNLGNTVYTLAATIENMEKNLLKIQDTLAK